MGFRDLSHDLTSGEPYPGDPEAAVEPSATLGDDGYRVAEIACSTHSGTHVDAPSHLLASGASLDGFDVSEFRFDARLVDCRDLGPRDAITADRVPSNGASGCANDTTGAANDGTDRPTQRDATADLLVVRTGWSDYWGDPEYFDHPYLTAEAAQRCVERDFTVAIDAPSVDPTPTEAIDIDEPSGYLAHETLLSAGSVILENVTGLAGLPARFTLHAYPLPVDADGAPVRAVAQW